MSKNHKMWFQFNKDPYYFDIQFMEYVFGMTNIHKFSKFNQAFNKEAVFKKNEDLMLDNSTNTPPYSCVGNPFRLSTHRDSICVRFADDIDMVVIEQIIDRAKKFPKAYKDIVEERYDFKLKSIIQACDFTNRKKVEEIYHANRTNVELEK